MVAGRMDRASTVIPSQNLRNNAQFTMDCAATTKPT